MSRRTVTLVCEPCGHSWQTKIREAEGVWIVPTLDTYCSRCTSRQFSSPDKQKSPNPSPRTTERPMDHKRHEEAPDDDLCPCGFDEAHCSPFRDDCMYARSLGPMRPPDAPGARKPVDMCHPRAVARES